MAGNVEKLINQITKDAEQTINKIIRDASAKAKKDFTKEAKICVDRYYREYDPWPNYSRTNNLLEHGYQPYTLWNKNKVQAGVRFIDRDSDFASVYDRDISSRDGWASGIGGIIINNLMIGSHGRSELQGTFIGDPVGEHMSKFEEAYSIEMDAYFRSNGLRRI